MLRIMCKSKIHNATVTEKNINYTGSIKIDEILLEKADIVPYEIVLVANLNNGQRFETYVIPGRKNSGEIALQGAAARLGEVGDKIIIISNTYLESEQARKYKPKFIYLNEKNKPK